MNIDKVKDFLSRLFKKISGIKKIIPDIATSEEGVRVRGTRKRLYSWDKAEYELVEEDGGETVLVVRPNRIRYSVKGVKVANENRRLFTWNSSEYSEHEVVPTGERILHPRYWTCDVCGNKYTRREYEDSWDWGGPHCPNPDCGNGGMALFAKEYGPIQNGKGVFIAKMEEIVKKKGPLD